MYCIFVKKFICYLFQKSTPQLPEPTRFPTTAPGSVCGGQHLGIGTLWQFVNSNHGICTSKSHVTLLCSLLCRDPAASRAESGSQRVLRYFVVKEQKTWKAAAPHRLHAHLTSTRPAGTSPDFPGEVACCIGGYGPSSPTPGNSFE